MAVPPSSVKFSATLLSTTGSPSATIATTQDSLPSGTSPGTLTFADVQATFPDANILGVNVTSANVVSTGRFDATLDASHSYDVPQGSAHFLLSASLDLGLAASPVVTFDATNSTDLSGVYDEASGQFSMSGTISDSNNIASGDLTLALSFTNRPPHAVISAPSQVPCTAPGVGTAVLSGQSSTDPDNDIASYGWTIDPNTTAAQTSSGPTVSVTLPLGTHTVQLEVRDSPRRIHGCDMADGIGALGLALVPMVLLRRKFARRNASRTARL